MGCALSSAEKEAVQRSLAIDKTLATEGATKQNEIKLLLLGECVCLKERERDRRDVCVYACMS